MMSKRKDELQSFQEGMKHTPKLEGSKGLCGRHRGSAWSGSGHLWSEKTKERDRAHLESSEGKCG